MPPTVAVVGLGRGRWWLPLPVPVILTWPFIGLGLGLVALADAASGRGRRAGLPGRAKTILLALWELHGLRIDVRKAAGRRVLVWML